MPRPDITDDPPVFYPEPSWWIGCIALAILVALILGSAWLAWHPIVWR